MCTNNLRALVTRENSTALGRGVILATVASPGLGDVGTGRQHKPARYSLKQFAAAAADIDASLLPCSYDAPEMSDRVVADEHS